MRATTNARQIDSLVADAAEFDAVVASGGDGTVADVAYALRGSRIPILVFPSGTANLLANNIGNAADPPALAQTLRANVCVDLDMCELEYRDHSGAVRRCGFLSMAGAGYDASIMQGSSNLKAFFGQFSYYLAALGNLDPVVARFELLIDGEPRQAEGICVLVGNWGAVRPDFKLIPGSDPTDGMLDVAVLTARHSVELIPTVIGSVLSHGAEEAMPNVEIYRARELTVTCDPAFPMQYDGEVIEGATTPFTVRVIPGGLRTFVDPLSPLSDRATATRRARP